MISFPPPTMVPRHPSPGPENTSRFHAAWLGGIVLSSPVARWPFPCRYDRGLPEVIAL